MKRALVLVAFVGCGSSGSGSPDGPAATQANGSIGAWQTTTPMPETRANHCATIAGGYFVVIGGNRLDGMGGFIKSANVHVAKIGGDGSLDAWKLAGITPSAVQQCTVTASGNRILIIDGLFDNTADEATVMAADLSADGALSTWNHLGPLPTGARVLSSEAYVSGTTLLVMYTDLSGNRVSALRSDLSNGLGAWATDDWIQTWRAYPAFAHSSGFVYSLGGYINPASGGITEAWVASVATSSTVGAGFATQPLPAPLVNGRAVAVDQYVFLVGGSAAVNGGSTYADTHSALAAADGSLGAWAAQTPLPAPRSHFAMAQSGDYVYVTGGVGYGDAEATVFYARVRF